MILFVDSAGFGCHIAIGENGKVLAVHQEPITRGHAEVMVPIFQTVMDDIDRSSEDIKQIVVNVGPGSFTGLRVAVVFATMMGYALKIPVQGITAFQAYSMGIDSDVNRLVVLDTKRDDYYVQALSSAHEPLSDAVCIKASGIQTMINHDQVLIGDAVEKLSRDMAVDNARHMTTIDAEVILNTIMNDDVSFCDARAFYIRDADVSQPKASTR